MKRLIVIFILSLIPFIGFCQETNKDTTKTEDVTITINISKINRTVGNVIGFFQEQKKEFKKDIDECMTEEDKKFYREKTQEIKGGLKNIVDEIHKGFREGLEKSGQKNK